MNSTKPNPASNPRTLCEKAAARRMVHFSYFSLWASRVAVVGSFNDWRPEAGVMCRLGTGMWTFVTPLLPGTYEYRFLVDGRRVPDPVADHCVLNEHGERNSLVAVAEVKRPAG